MNHHVEQYKAADETQKVMMFFHGTLEKNTVAKVIL